MKIDKKAIQVRLYTDEDDLRLIEFVKKVWDKDLTREKFLRLRKEDFKKNPYSKECGFPVVLALYKDSVVGHIALKPCGFLVEGKEVPGYWQAGIHVFPEFRGHGLATKMSEILIQDRSMVTGFFVVEQTFRIKRRLGWDIPGKVPEYIKFLKPKELLNKIDLNKIEMIPGRLKVIFNIVKKLGNKHSSTLFSSVINTYSKLISSFTSVPETSNIKIVDEFDDRIDDLWEHNKKYLINAQVRRSQYLNWAFKSNVGWVKAIYELDGKILGYVILSLKYFQVNTRLAGIKSASIIDVFWDLSQPKVYKSLISFSENFACANDADILFCTINKKNTKKMLIRNGFLNIPKSVNFSVYTSDGKMKYSKDIQDWFLTRGDADAAGALGREIRG